MSIYLRKASAGGAQFCEVESPEPIVLLTLTEEQMNAAVVAWRHIARAPWAQVDGWLWELEDAVEKLP